MDPDAVANVRRALLAAGAADTVAIFESAVPTSAAAAVVAPVLPRTSLSSVEAEASVAPAASSMSCA